MIEHFTSDGLLRSVQGVLTGIGFLGAGVIMHAQGKDEVHGLTTAATKCPELVPHAKAESTGSGV